MAAQGMSAEEIKELLARYAIGQKPLARLLGWGETTILHYAKKGCPEGEFAARLRRLSEEPPYFFRVLEEGKERLTPVAYKKCRLALQKLLVPSKTEAAANYLMARANADTSPFRVVMTLYYVQAVTAGLAKEMFFSEECGLSENGEIPYAGLYEKIRQRSTAWNYEMRCGGIKDGADAGAQAMAGTGEKLLDTEEERLLGEVYDMLAWYGPEELKKIFASERPYLKKSREGNGQKCIRHAAFAAYYKKVVQGYKVIAPADFNNYFSERAGRKKHRGTQGRGN